MDFRVESFEFIAGTPVVIGDRGLYCGQLFPISEIVMIDYLPFRVGLKVMVFMN